MRSHEERFAETKRRIAATASAFAQGNGIAGINEATSMVSSYFDPGDFAGYETAASMYGGGAALGYIVIGLLSFLLGVCVTVLCFRLRQINREDSQDREDEGRHGAD